MPKNKHPRKPAVSMDPMHLAFASASAPYEKSISLSNEVLAWICMLEALNLSFPKECRPICTSVWYQLRHGIIRICLMF